MLNAAGRSIAAPSRSDGGHRATGGAAPRLSPGGLAGDEALAGEDDRIERARDLPPQNRAIHSESLFL